MAFEMIVENAADAARDMAVGKPEIFLRPFRKARIEGRVVRGAGGAQPGVEGLGVLGDGDRGIEVGAAAEPALRRRQEAGVHMDRGDMRVGHVRDQADAGGEEARVLFRAGDAPGEYTTCTSAGSFFPSLLGEQRASVPRGVRQAPSPSQGRAPGGRQAVEGSGIKQQARDSTHPDPRRDWMGGPVGRFMCG